MSSSRHPTILTLLQWAILITSSLFYVMARNSGLMANMLLNTYQAKAREERFLLSRATSTSIDQDDQPSGVRNKSGWALKKPDTLPRDDSSPELSQLEAFLNASKITETGKNIVRYYQQKAEETQPLRHLRFDNIKLPEIPKGTPIMKTAYRESTAIVQAPWFPHRKECSETCCAQAVAISLKQDRNRIINAVDGQDVADLLLYGHSIPPIHTFAATELTDEIIPCLRPGVIIHADSYRGPITRFFEQHRPNITVPYVFLTTKTDGDSPISFFKDRLDTDPLLLAWYGINPKYDLGANHSKFRMMPLGLTGNKYRQQPDLDLLMQARNHTNPFGGSKERWLNSTLWESAVDTTPLLFVKFGFHENALHREVPWNMACENRTMPALDDLSCNKNKGANPRQTYTAASKYLFGLSPPGNGMDCFRTYELLLNGIIPIVQAQPEYDELFRDLPVLQIPHWNYTQSELVELMHDFVKDPSFQENSFDEGWDRLHLQYWRQHVLKDAGRLDEIVTDPEGNQNYIAWQYTPFKKPLIEHAIPEHVEIRRKKQEERKRLQEIKQKGEPEAVESKPLSLSVKVK